MKKVLNKHTKNAGSIFLASAITVMSALSVDAATVTDTFTAQIIITDDCSIVSAGDLDFGSAGILAANVDATATLSVQCTNTTPYDIGLDAGVGSGATTAVRRMSAGAETVDYLMFSDAGRITNWGNNVSTDTVTGAGDGSAITHTIYGRVPAQTTPSSGTYQDTVTVTVTY
ncbi:MAG: spore coat U domain-containing protein [Hyphomicrobiales bacterium]|nr:spore coat U domain-containing protein [Hyphomicrobiales bacterium]